MTKFTLSWPPSALWPNARPHWAQKAKATKQYRQEAAILARGAVFAPIRVTFCPKPSGPFPDADNAKAAFKAAQDGIADALKVNDRHFDVIYEFGERCKNGAVIVEIGYSKHEPMP